MIRIFEKNNVLVASLEVLPLLQAETVGDPNVHLLSNGHERFLAKQDFLNDSGWSDVTDQIDQIPFEHRINLFVDNDREDYHQLLMESLNMGTTMAVEMTASGCVPILINPSLTETGALAHKPQLSESVGFIRMATSHIDAVDNESDGFSQPVVAIMTFGILFSGAFDMSVAELGYRDRDEAIENLNAAISAYQTSEGMQSIFIFNLPEKPQQEGELPE